ncbi:MAG: replicative DNA helicase [Opitutales bacterium]|nr:replicative DNA helicase [Opitutales bacterium]
MPSGSAGSEGDQPGRSAPANAEAEAGLLAGCLLDPGDEIISACIEAGFEPESFFTPAHSILFYGILEAYKKGLAVDEVVVAEHLASTPLENVRWLREKHRRLAPETPLLEMMGGARVIAEITDRDLAPTLHARQWMEIVREKWLLRRLIQTASRITEGAYSGQEKVEVFIDQVEQQILKINETRYVQGAVHFEQAVDAATHLISQILQGRNDSGVLTGFSDVDNLTFGLHPGQMIVLAARPSMGKTSFGMNIVENAALPTRGEAAPILVFSLEMPADQLAMRMLCGRARVNMSRVRNRFVGKEEQKELARVAHELKKAPLWIDDSSNLNILELRAKARRAHKKHNLKLIVIDYLQLIAGTDSRVPREQQISEISRGIKGMAKELNLPVLVLSQLNRASEKENRAPRISDLRESGSIEQDADVVFLLASRMKSDDNPSIPQASQERELIVAKQRNGPTGSAPLTFLTDFTRFENYTPARE